MSDRSGSELAGLALRWPSVRACLRLIGCLSCAAAICVPALYASLRAGLGRIELVIDAHDVTPNGDGTYAVRLHSKRLGLRIDSDGAGGPFAPLARLVEDGRELGRAMPHVNLRDQGEGRFSIRDQSLHFSTSDGSDPRINGREYRVVAYHVLQPLVVAASPVLFLLGALLITSTSPRRTGSPAERVAAVWRAVRAAPGAPASPPQPPQAATLAGVALGVLGALLLLFSSSPPFLPARLDLLVIWGTVSLCVVLVMLLIVRSALGGRNEETRTRGALVVSLSLPMIGMVAFALPVYEAWRGVRTRYATVGGLLPWSDALDYYRGALHLLETGLLDDWNARRPVNAALLAVRLLLTGGDLQLTIALQTVIVALACLMAAREVGRSFGLLSAVMFFATLLAFASDYTPTTLSETHGLAFGTLAFATLCRAATERSRRAFAVGMFVLSLALGARSGAFLVLPALLAWALVWLKSKGEGRRSRLSWDAAIIGGVAALGGLAVPLLFHALWGTSGQLPQGNFSYTLYGMAVGGGPWTQIYTDHPELFAGAGGGRGVEAEIYRLAFEQIRTRPHLFAQAYFANLARFPIVFLGIVPDHIFAVASAIGLVFLLTARRTATSALLLYAQAGILLSSPFLLTDGGRRVFAATVPFQCVFAAVALYAATRAVTGLVGGVAPTRAQPADFAAFPAPQSIAAVVAALAIVAPVIGIPSKSWPKTGGFSCPAGQESATFTGRTSAVLRIHPDDRLPASHVPDVRFGDFARDPAFAGVEIGRWLRELRAPSTIILTDATTWLLVHGRSLDLQPGMLYRMCGRRLRSEPGGYRVLAVDTIQQ